MNSARQKIVNLLEQVTGLNVETISDSTFRQAIQHRMDTLRLEDIETYVQRVAGCADELGRLTEEIVVPETWFFRHKRSFDILIDQIFQAQQHSRHFLFRILSLPCSTGEEPYSIIMALLQAGVNPNHVYIKAVDISERALAIARRGVYGRNSFRSKELSFRDTFFNQVDQEFVINESIRSKVHFSQGNITDSSFTESLGRFDIIFCRNILIYFGSKTQKKVIDDFYNLLVRGGTLFTGHAEANLFLNSRFLRSPHAESFAFHKRMQDIAVETYDKPAENVLETPLPMGERPPARPRPESKKTMPSVVSPPPHHQQRKVKTHLRRSCSWPTQESWKRRQMPATNTCRSPDLRAAGTTCWALFVTAWANRKRRSASFARPCILIRNMRKACSCCPCWLSRQESMPRQ